MKRAIILLLLLAAPTLAENDFTSDANCVAWWNFENDDTFGQDLSGNGSHFSYWDGVVRSSTYKHGDGSSDFESSNNVWLYALDASLSSDFPGKSGAANGCFTITCWLRFESISAWQVFYGKYSTNAGFLLLFNPDTNPDTFKQQINNTTIVQRAPATAIAADQWYFLAAVWDDPNNYWYLYIWDDTNQEQTTNTDTSSYAMSDPTGTFQIGNATGATNVDMDGLIDDVRIFSRVLPQDDINDVRDDVLDMDSEPNLVAWYEMDTSGAPYDSSGNGNHLFSASGPDTTTYKVGTAALPLDRIAGDATAKNNGVLDADLPAGFPTKNGDTTKKMTVCFWYYYTEQNTGIVGKGMSSTNDASWHIGCTPGGTDYFWAATGEPGGATWDGVSVQSGNMTIDSPRWLHVAFRYDDDPNSYDWRIWDDTAGAVVATNSGTWNFGNDWNIEAGMFMVSNGSWSGPAGTIDELVISNDIMTDDEIDAIRGGTYGPSGSPIHHFRRRRN